MDERTEITAIVQNVFLNWEGQQKWIDDTPELFFSSADTFAKHIVAFDRLDMFRFGITIGGLYERWQQSRKEDQP